MKGVLVAVVLVMGAGTASAGPTSFAGVALPSGGSGYARGTSARTAFVDSRSGVPHATVTTLHPVVGSVDRKHFANPITHKAKYKDTVYNPVLGQFKSRTFRR